MNNLPIVLDNFIENDLQDKIEDAMFDCLWSYTNDNSLGSKTLEMKHRKFISPIYYDVSPAFIADMLVENIKIYNKILPMVKKSCDKIKFNIKKVRRCYGAIHAITRNISKTDNIHINFGMPHLVMLYYVNDSDGDTVIFDKTLDDIPNGIHYPDEYCTLNITHRISPKRGRVLFFDGKFYHASSSPTKSVRSIITLDLFGEFEDQSYKFLSIKNQK
jgi:hypothetical protein